MLEVTKCSLYPGRIRAKKNQTPRAVGPKLRLDSHLMEFEPSNVNVIQLDVSLEDLMKRAVQREMLYYSRINDKPKKTLRNGDPHNPPREGNCPIDDLPDELLSYVFQLGVETEREEWDENSDSSDEEQWEDVDDEQDSDETSDDETSDGANADEASANSSDLSRALSVTESDLQDDCHTVDLPFQVLVTHVCRRWRSVALDSHRFWTVLTFRDHPRLAQTKEYISRSNGLPLTIELDCSTNDDTSDVKGLELSDASEDEKDLLSLEDLGQILDLLEPEVSHWGTFIFHSSSYDYVQFLMSRLDKLPTAPCLESFQLHIYEERDNSVVIPAAHKIRYLPFHGRAPNLKEAVFWGIHIDWEAALPNFLRGLRDLELSFLMDFERPTYATFAEIIKNSPDLRTLTLSQGGPILPDGVAFDSGEAWGPVPLAIPSLTELVLQYHEPKYAAALVQHLNVPSVTHLLLDFDEEDYSGFVQTLAKPVKGRDQSLLQQINHLKISGLPCDIASVEALLSQLVSLQSLNLKIYGPEEEVIYDKLVNPQAPTTMSRGVVDLPKLFCPKLEEITTTGLDAKGMKALIIARRDAGAPLKRVHMAINHELLTDDELWIRENVEELHFYEPSDSDSEEECESDCHEHC
jgi:hypothetical protein